MGNETIGLQLGTTEQNAEGRRTEMNEVLIGVSADEEATLSAPRFSQEGVSQMGNETIGFQLGTTELNAERRRTR